MTKITIRTIGNRSLYRSLAESMDSESHHRTASGAVRRMIEIDRLTSQWAKNSGQWGHIEISIDDKTLDDIDAWELCLDRLHGSLATTELLRRWKKAIA